MRILYFATNFPYYSETFVIEEIKQLKEKGHEVVVCNFTWYKSEQDSLNFGVVNNTKNPFLLFKAIVLNAISNSSIFFNVETWKSILSCMLKRPEFLWKYLYLLFSTDFLLSKVKEENVDCAISHFLFKSTLAGHLICNRMKIPLHIRLHTKRSLYPGNVLRQILSRASGLTAESRDVGHYYEDYLSKSRSIKVIRQSIDIEKLQEVDVPIKLEAEVRLIAIGRLVSKKGFDVLIEALSICRDSVLEKVSLDIYGSGQLQLPLEKLVRDKGIEHIVRFRGVLEHQDLMKKLAMADLLIVPSIELSDDVDGVPTVIAESMVLGTAVLSTPVAGISELVVDNVTGFLAAPNSADELKTKLECLVNDRTKRESVIVAASDKVASEYKITLASELY